MFALEQLVVYPAQGVGKIERIENKEIGGMTTNFYIVRILSNNVTLMVPVPTASSVGLRALSSVAYSNEVIESLKDHSSFTGYVGQNWNRRYREYSERLKSEDLADVSYVLKELLLISQDKELSFGERRLLEQAMTLLCTELSCVLNEAQETIRSQIEEIFHCEKDTAEDDTTEVTENSATANVKKQ